jgi:hypothetical protein
VEKFAPNFKPNFKICACVVAIPAMRKLAIKNSFFIVFFFKVFVMNTVD